MNKFGPLHIEIIGMLSDDDDEAMECMCQLIANLILSMEDMTKEKVIEKIEKHLLAYQRKENELFN